MKLLPALLLALVASTALAHGNHDDETFEPLKPGAKPKPAPSTAQLTEADKQAKLKAEKKAAETAKPAATPTP